MVQYSLRYWPRGLRSLCPVWHGRGVSGPRGHVECLGTLRASVGDPAGRPGGM